MTAEFAELPWIYFESDGTPIVARYGSDVRQPPRYDLEAVRASLRIEKTCEAGWGEARAIVWRRLRRGPGRPANRRRAG